MNVEHLNFHHLRYFWAVAKEGNLTRAAARLRVAQSALSAQIRELEGGLGHVLFHREKRGVSLTEAGAIVLAYAEEIFRTGTQLVTTLERGRAVEQPLRIGAAATLSRNFQESFVKPLLAEPGVRLCLESGVLGELLPRLESHRLDLVLANRPPPRDGETRLRCRRLARQAVSIVGAMRPPRFRFPEGLAGASMILPGRESALRSEFDAMCEQRGVRVHVLAEVDDMATIRLLARDTAALALVPTVVVRDELRAGLLHELAVLPGLFETFYAITAERTFQHPLLAQALARKEADLLETARARPPRARTSAPGPVRSRRP